MCKALFRDVETKRLSHSLLHLGHRLETSFIQSFISRSLNNPKVKNHPDYRIASFLVLYQPSSGTPDKRLSYFVHTPLALWLKTLVTVRISKLCPEAVCSLVPTPDWGEQMLTIGNDLGNNLTHCPTRALTPKKENTKLCPFNWWCR